jgi:hypothetical protein
MWRLCPICKILDLDEKVENTLAYCVVTLTTIIFLQHFNSAARGDDAGGPSVSGGFVGEN